MIDYFALLCKVSERQVWTNNDKSRVSFMIPYIFARFLSQHIILMYLFLDLINLILFVLHKSTPFAPTLLLLIRIVLSLTKKRDSPGTGPHWIRLWQRILRPNHIFRWPVLHVIYLIVTLVAHVPLTIDTVCSLWFDIDKRRNLITRSMRWEFIINMLRRFFANWLMFRGIHSIYRFPYRKLYKP